MIVMKKKVKMESSRKVPRELENPIDNLFIDVAERTAPYFHKIGFMPNTITTISFLMVVPLVYFYHIFNNLIAVLFLILMYYFDHLDGLEARKYHLETEFGDFYDHAQDLVVFFVIDLFVFLRIWGHAGPLTFWSLLIITLGLMYMMQVHIGNEEKYFNLKHKSRAKRSVILRYLVKETPNWKLKFTRWFGPGTFILWNIVLIFLSNIIAY